MIKKKQNILIHILGSLIFLSLPILFSPDFNEQNSIIDILTSRPFQRPFAATCLLLTFFYANYYVFIPKLYIPKKYVLFSVVILVSFLIVLFVPELFIIGKKMGPPQHAPHYPGPPPKKPFGLLVNHNLFQFIGVFAFSLLLKIRERLKQTEAEKTNAELSYLKAQINPHFLFNTLNSIYSLAILKSDKTADALVKLSDMMRYVLNDSNANFTALEKELNYIANYIELQRMRLTPNVKLNYSCEGNVFDKKIAPLVLIPFIENAFKHGVNSEEDSDIDVKINITNTELRLIVKNKCVTTNNNTLNKSGLGIENTKQRLNLLYPENHSLDISEIENYYIVDLTLNIHD
jgi:hypothetical protein